MTPEEYDKIKDDKEIKEISFRILVGDLEGDVFLKLRNEVCYVEELDAKMNFIELEAGHFPVKEDEIMLSDVTLEALEVPSGWRKDKSGCKYRWRHSISGIHIMWIL